MSSSVELAFDAIERPGAHRRALFLHGILGSGPNLRTLARRFVEARPGWDAWLVDLRGHGASPKGSPGPSLAAAAQDVADLASRGAVPVAALIGHSFGGKVALAAVARMPGGHTLEHVVTLDSPPGAREPQTGGDSALSVLEMLEGLRGPFASKSEFVDAVRAKGRGKTIAQWLAMSTEPVEGGVRFALDLQEIRALVTDYFAQDLWPVVESSRAGMHFVVGDRSSAWSAEERARAAALAARDPRVTVDVLPTDHWVHAEDPEGLMRILLDRIGARD